ncbi:glycogen debranching protein GlgX, partial [Thermoproteota archaeon]
LEHKTKKRVSPGISRPRGATIRKNGVNFSIFSKYAKEVYLLLFDSPKGRVTDVIKLKNRTGYIWHVLVEGIGAGQLYGYKVVGDYDPKHGKRFNEHKLLMDPYAKAITGKFRDKDYLLFGYKVNSTKKDLKKDMRENKNIVPKSIVMDDSFDWQGDRRPSISLNKLVIYETHVKGFTAHPSSGVKYPGTYLGFIEKIPHLKELGVNAVELLPVYEFHIGNFLVEKELTEYWGYNPIGFFAPESSYSTGVSLGCQISEFKTMVKELHRAGIEVIIDVVYNHTGEGNELGPTICFRGIDNANYYSLGGHPKEPYRHYVDYTGCGNMLNPENLWTLRIILDSMHYWAEEMHVDGFRFDLASSLGRVSGNFNPQSVFLRMISADPILKNIKLIAEPWDLKSSELSNFPLGWSEWNGIFRDTFRRFIKGDSGMVGEVAKAVSGSSDLFTKGGRSPSDSINFITCHDGFTLNDLFSYNHKHNEANKEENRDGSDHNDSWNCGVEGDTEDIAILALRRKLIKNSICCLFFSLGTPMMLGGDEFLRKQSGNNNSYCQDNEISWFNWEYLKANSDIFEFYKKAIAFRKRYTILHRDKFFLGKDTDNDRVIDITWFDMDGKIISWDKPPKNILCYQIDGSESPSELGNYHLFFVLNSDSKRHLIKLPQHKGMSWHRVVNTSLKSGEDFLESGKKKILKNQEHYQANPRSVVVLLGV